MFRVKIPMSYVYLLRLDVAFNSQRFNIDLRLMISISSEQSRFSPHIAILTSNQRTNHTAEL